MSYKYRNWDFFAYFKIHVFEYNNWLLRENDVYQYYIYIIVSVYVYLFCKISYFVLFFLSSVNPYLKIKTEPKTSTCCGPAIPNSLQKVNSTSKYDYGERRYLTGSDHTPSSPSGSVCSSSSGKESSSLSPCSKDVSQYSNGTDSSCTYMNRSPERYVFTIARVTSHITWQ